MTVKIILYDRENLLLDSFREALYNFSEVLFRENFLKERFDFIKPIFPCLNYP